TRDRKQSPMSPIGRAQRPADECPLLRVARTCQGQTHRRSSSTEAFDLEYHFPVGGLFCHALFWAGSYRGGPWADLPPLTRSPNRMIVGSASSWFWRLRPGSVAGECACGVIKRRSPALRAEAAVRPAAARARTRG